MAQWPARGTSPWDGALKSYIDARSAEVAVATVAAQPTVVAAATSAVANAFTAQKIVTWDKSPILYTNYVLNPDGYDTNASDTTPDVWGRTDTTTTVVSSTASLRTRAKNIRVTPAGVSYSGAVVGVMVPALGSSVVAFGWFRPDADTDMNFATDFLTVTERNHAINGDGTTRLLGGRWTFLWQRGTVTNPSGAMFLRNGAGASTVPFHAEGVSVIVGSAPAEPFTGDDLGCYWTGTKYASTSVKTMYAKGDALETATAPELSRNHFRFPLRTTEPAWYATGVSDSDLDGIPAYSLVRSGGALALLENLAGSRVPVTPGQMAQYGFLADVPAGSRVSTDLGFYDASNTRISDVSTGRVDTLGPYKGRVATAKVAAPSGAATVSVRVYSDAGNDGTVKVTQFMAALGEDSALQYVDGDQPGCRWTGAYNSSPSVRMLHGRGQALEVAKSPELARNYMKDPTGSQVGTEMWGVTTGNVAYDAATLLDGRPNMRLTRSGGAVAVAGVDNTAGNTSTAPGENWIVSALVDVPAGMEVKQQLVFLDAASGLVSYGATEVISGPFHGRRNSAPFAVPANAYIVRPRWYCDNGGDGIARVTDMMLTKGSAPSSSYFDGDTLGCRWVGARSRSASVKILHTTVDEQFLTWLDAGRAQGSGSPEGKVVASVGTRYVDTRATNGAIEWIKASGTGNTGWRVAYGDTGARAVTNLLSGFTGAMTIRRVNNTVELALFGLNGSAQTSSDFYLFPAGFGPSVLAMGSTNGDAQLLVNLYSNKAFMNSSLNGQFGFLSFPTADSWPTTLPGTPA